MITIPRRRASYVPILLGGLVMLLMTWEVSGRPTAQDAAPFHKAAAEAIAAIPSKFGDWEASDVPIPASARTLLKPNALMCRACRNASTGERASLVLVQCRDSRDMAGHYPPICYPGQGWVESDTHETVDIPLKNTTIKAVRYEFRRSAFDQDRWLVVYDFFAIPGQGLPLDMAAVRRAAADYTARPFGAAQIQVVFDGHRAIAEESQVVAALLTPVEPVISLLSDPKWRSR